MSDSFEGIAIIAMSGRFPGAKNIETFWENLRQGKESITFFSEDELLKTNIPKEKIQNPNYIKVAPILEDVAQFDASFFKYSPKEAIALDPQQRLFLECAWQTLENAGYSTENLAKSVGVFAGSGASISSYLLSYLEQHPEAKGLTGSYHHLANDKDFLTTRVSYKLNLNGPSMAIQSACSTSLVAVHVACQSILNGECEMALAGGVSIRIPQTSGYLWEPGSIFSQDGHLRAFDAKAKGIVFGSGLGIILLKPLDKALQDKDTIYAVIKGSAVNNDGGEKLSYTASSYKGQIRCIQEALEVSQIEPKTIGYIEAHGTGTTMGDPIEFSALNHCFQTKKNSEKFCAVGSVKNNVGHLDMASGIVGLIKATLILKYGEIPPLINFETPNPNLHLEKTPFYFNTDLKTWEKSKTPRRAGVNSLGMGGTNAFVLLEEAPQIVSPKVKGKKPFYLLCLSAKTDDSLQQKVSQLARWLQKDNKDQTLENIAFTLHIGRYHFNKRCIFVSNTIEELKKLLQKAQHNLFIEIPNYLVYSKKALKEKKSSLYLEIEKKLLSELQTNPTIPAKQFKQKLLSLGELYLKGFSLDWEKLHAGETQQRIPLPTYPFQKEEFWIATTNDSEKATSSNQAKFNPLISEKISSLTKQKNEFSPSKITPKKSSLPFYPFKKEKYWVETSKSFLSKEAKQETAHPLINKDLHYYQESNKKSLLSLKRIFQKISLPTYPFEKEKYWIETTGNSIKNQLPAKSILHPLMGKNVSVLEEASNGSRFVLKGDRKKIPLPTYLFIKKRCWLNSSKNKEKGKVFLPQMVPHQTTKKRLGLKEKEKSLFEEQPISEAFKKEIESKVNLELIEKEIALVQMNDSQQRNMLSKEMILGLQHRFTQLSKMKELKVVILTGYDNVFCMGGVKDELVRISEQRMDFEELQFLYRGLLEFELPVITAMQGHAYGGGLLFGLYGDIVLMAEESIYSANFIKYGFTPGLGSTFLLEKKIGSGIANEMMFTAKSFTGQELKERGASVLFRKQHLVLEEAFLLAKNLTEKTQTSLKILKQGLAENIQEHLYQTVAKEAQMIKRSSLDPSMRARVDVFFDKTVDHLNPNKTNPPLKEKNIALEKVEETSIEIAPQNLEAKVKQIFKTTLNFDENEIDVETSFNKMGIDSIVGVEVIRDINREFNLNLEVIVLYDYPNIQKLSTFLIHEISSLKKSQPTFQKKSIDVLPENEINQHVEKEYCDKKELSSKLNLKPLTKHGLPKSRKYISEGKRNKLPLKQLKPKSNLKINEILEKKSVFPSEKIEFIPKKKKEKLEIAVVGLSGRFPGSKNVEMFWENLASGKNSITEIPPNRWDINNYYNPDPNAKNKSISKQGGFLDEIEYFNPLFFKISPAEAYQMDPQQRLFLEECWKALEDSGHSPQQVTNKKCGVFVGVGQSQYLNSLREQDTGIDGQTFTGTSNAILAARISYFLNLKGPTLAVDTACSSSLVAIHLACQSILNGESEMALAGGICLITSPDIYILTSKIGMLSQNGQCRAFDNKADGIVLGEGVGVVVLKPLQKAIEDSDQIYGVIKGSRINQDGETNGITAPSANSQTNLESELYQKYQINSENISYVETHGTGTKLGDPIEIKALTNSFQKQTNKKQFCAIGSVKTNIGHTMTAAGIAGFIKILLSLKYKKIPPSLNCETENEHINFKETPFYVNKTLKEWKTSENKPRMAALSSFGFSGTNAHLVLEEFREKETSFAEENPYYLITLSAKTNWSLRQRIQDLLQWVTEKKLLNKFNLVTLSYNLNVRKTHFEKRFAVVVANQEGLRQKLEDYLKKIPSETISNIENKKRLKKEASLEELLKNIEEKLRVPLNSLSNQEYKNKLNALADLYLKEYNIHFEKFYSNHAIPKISLPTYPFKKEKYWITTSDSSNAVSLTTKLKNHPLLFETDSKLIKSLSKALPPQNEIWKKISLPTYPFKNEKYWITTSNNSNAVSLTTKNKNHPLLFERNSTLKTRLSKNRSLQNGIWKKISLPTYPFKAQKNWVATSNQPNTDSLTTNDKKNPLLLATVSLLERNLNQNRFIQNKTVQKISLPTYAFKAEKNWPNQFVTFPIKFEKQAHPLITARISPLEIDSQQNSFTSNNNLKKLKRLSLPNYSFASKKIWFNETTKHSSNSIITKLHPLVEKNISTLKEQKFSTTLTGQEFFLKDHIVVQQKVLPGAAYLEMARFAAHLASESQLNTFKNIAWLSPFISTKEEKNIFVGISPDQEQLSYYIWTENTNGNRILHSQGNISSEESSKSFPSIVLSEIKNRCENQLKKKECYSLFQQMGLDYGPSFQTIEALFSNETEVLAKLKLPASCEKDFQSFVLHPSMLDGIFQSVLGFIQASNEKQTAPFVPYTLKELTWFKSIPQECYVHITSPFPQLESDLKRFNFEVFDLSGQKILSIQELTLKKIKSFSTKIALKATTEKTAVHFHRPNWKKTPLNLTPANLFSLPSETTLIFEPEQSFRNNVAKSPLFIWVRPGKEFRVLGEQSFQINPKKEQDYARLIETLKKKESLPKNIIHLWSEKQFVGKNKIALEALLQKSFYSIFYLTQALLKEKTATKLLYTYFENPDKIQPQYAAISGLLKTITLEAPKFQVKSLKLPLINNKPLAESQLQIIFSELQTFEKQEMEVSYQLNERFVKQFKLIEKPIQQAQPIQKGGVYIITGGLGGLGEIFASYLAKQKAKLVLTGRTLEKDIPKIKVEKLSRLGASEVYYIKADVSKYSEVTQLLTKTKQKFGKINGILHSAGTLEDALLTKKTTSQIEKVFAPKIAGTLYLDEATQNESLDFFVLFSSLSAVLGNIGQSDYAYANCFMDHFASYRECLRSRQQRTGKTLSINWPLWQEGGMKIEAQTEEWLARIFKMSPLKTEDGIQAFLQALSTDENQIIIENSVDGKIFENKIKPKVIDKTKLKIAPQDKELLQLKIKATLLKMTSDILKIPEEELELEDELSSFGFDSFALTEFGNRLTEELQLQLDPTVFFEYPSLEAFSSYLVQEHSNSLLAHYNIQTKVPLEEFVLEKPAIKELIQQTPTRFSSSTYQWKSGNGNQTEKEPIAIIGISGRFPQSKELEEFWEHLVNEENLVSEIPSSRWDWRDYFGDPLHEPNKTNCKWGGFIDDIDKFDASFFKIPPREAKLMDPQQRLLIQEVWKTIENAGYKASELSNSKIGLFIGASTNDYAQLLKQSSLELDGLTSTGLAHSILANRISYFFNFKGPSETIDTACSSSIVALNRAVKSIQYNECKMAIVGGVNALLTPDGFICFSKAGMLSSEGLVRTFDKKAKGYVRGEGVGAILLKPLSKAEKDQDHIYAIIKATGVNHGGKGHSLVAPNPKAQAELIIDTYQSAQIEPESISYIEAHGTATSLGDPIEINAFKKAFAQLSNGLAKKNYCGIGSLKPNIGHLEAASGMASLFKLIFALKHQKIPATLNLEEVNPQIHLEESPFYLVKQTQKWSALTAPSGKVLPRRASLHSFGFGGTNGHLILEENLTTRPQDENKIPQLIVLSAMDKERLKEQVQQICSFIQKQPQTNFGDLAYTLQIGREEMPERLALVAQNKEELIEKCKIYLQSNENEKHLEIYQGNSKQNQIPESLAKIFQGNSGKQFFESILKNKELNTLATLWVSGKKIEWSDLHSGQQTFRIPLPVYSFEKKRFWISKQEERPLLESKIEKIEGFPLIQDKDNFEQWIIAWISDELEISKEEVDLNQRLQDYGINSLILNQLLIKVEKEIGFQPPLHLFFSENLQFIIEFVQLKGMKEPKNFKKAISRNLESYATLEREIKQVSKSLPKKTIRDSIFLTGATGFLGAFLLDELLQQTNKKIVCLVRANSTSEALKRVQQNLENYQLNTFLLSERIKVVTGDLSKEKLGLSDELWEELIQSVAAIYHSGALVNWIHPYENLEKANVFGTREVIRFAFQGNKIPLHFISSTGVFPVGQVKGAIFKEEEDIQYGELLQIGYFQTKWVAEKLIEKARDFELPIRIYRPAYISGHSETGIEPNTTDQFLTSFITGCLQLKKAPQTKQLLNPVPVDYVASSIVHLSLKKKLKRTKFNLINTVPISYSNTYKLLRSLGHSLEEIPYSEWRELILQLPQTNPDNPLAKFKLFFELFSESVVDEIGENIAESVVISGKNAQMLLSRAKLNCPPLDRRLLNIYLENFKKRGLLQSNQTLQIPSTQPAPKFEVNYASFNRADLLKNAIEISGFHDFNSGEFLEPLDIFIHALNSEAKISKKNSWLTNLQLTNFLVSRAKIVETLKRNPSAGDQKIQRPIFITGFHRTGTTLLHHLLDLIPTNRALKLWEMASTELYTNISPQIEQEKIREVQWLLDSLYKLSPEFKKIHPMSSKYPEECNWLFRPTFANPVLALSYHVPEYFSWYLNHDMKTEYQFYRTQLQLLKPRTGENRLVLKDPFHLFKFDALFDVFPDATVICLHRKPEEFIPSLASLCNALLQIHHPFTQEEVGAYAKQIVLAGLDSMLAFRKSQKKSSSFIDIKYLDLVKSPIQAIRKICSKTNIPLTQKNCKNLSQWLAKKPLQKHGKHKYSLEQFGLNPKEIQEAFATYQKLFL